MSYERLRDTIVHCSGSHVQGASILIRRGMFVWMKTWACFKNKETYSASDTNREENVGSDVYPNAVLLMANMVMNNHLQRMGNV